MAGNDEGTLREKARKAIQAGMLPSRPPDRVWGGPGAGTDCTLCGEALRHDGLEFETEFARGDVGPGIDTRHFHIRCFAAWEFERHALELETGAGPSRAKGR